MASWVKILKEGKAKRSIWARFKLKRLIWLAGISVTAIVCITVPLQVLVYGLLLAICVTAIASNPQKASGQSDVSGGQSDNQLVNGLKLYRIQELQRIIASLKAKGPILVVGKEGIGKTVLANAVVQALKDEGFLVASAEPATPKYMLTKIADQLNVETRSLDGKVFLIDELKAKIASYLQENTAFLVVDDVHRCDAKVRHWLKLLKRHRIPILLLATNPPLSDVFINMPRIELGRLPEYAIREVMEHRCLELGVSLKQSDLARLQERAGGNPMLAERAVEEEHLGVDVRAGDHGQYVDATPLLLFAGTFFIILRFIALGTGNHALYILGGISVTLFISTSRLLCQLPKQSKRID